MYHLALFIYNLLFPLLFALYWPWYRRRLQRRGEFREGFGERFGRFSAAKAATLAATRDAIWIHAVSVGEVNVALALLRAWQQREPTRAFVLSTTTNTGQLLARQKAPAGVTVIYAPLDCWPWVAATLRLIRPAALVVLEVELWPTLLHLAGRLGVPVALVNARMSDRTAAGLRRHRWFFRRVLRQFTLIEAQTEEDASRLRLVGGDALPLRVLGNLKFDQVSQRQGQAVTPWLERAFGPGPCQIICGASTWPGEEAMLWRTWQTLRGEFPQLRLILVPRHAERAPGVVAEAQAAGVTLLPLQAARAGEAGLPAAGPATVLLVNTTGELLDFLAASTLVLVGKSLAGNRGGHNPIEPAMFGRPVLFGPAMDNFRDIARLFQEAQAAQVVADEAELLTALRHLLADETARQRLGQAGQALVERQRGATGRTLDWLLEQIT